MAGFWTWGVALALYAVFLAWYVNWRGPVRAAEVDGLIGRILAADPEVETRNDLSIMRRFLETDDGREFFMLNLVRLSPEDVADPVTGERRPARAVMSSYTRVFLPALARRAGHPAWAARKVGGYFDAWGVDEGPDWSIVGYMRYRSRRDLAELVADPRFGGAHDFKFAAMPQTFSFPTQPAVMLPAGPRVWVALALALAAAVGQTSVLLAAGAGG